MNNDSNFNDLVRKQLNLQAAEEDRPDIMELVTSSVYETCAMLINEAPPPLRGVYHEACVVACRALSRFFADDAVNTHGIPRHVIEETMVQAERMGAKMTASPLSDERISAIKTPLDPIRSLDLPRGSALRVHIDRSKG